MIRGSTESNRDDQGASSGRNSEGGRVGKVVGVEAYGGIQGKLLLSLCKQEEGLDDSEKGDRQKRDHGEQQSMCRVQERNAEGEGYRLRRAVQSFDGYRFASQSRVLGACVGQVRQSRRS